MKPLNSQTSHDCEGRSVSAWGWARDRLRSLTSRGTHENRSADEKIALAGRYCTNSSADLFVAESSRWLQVLHEQMSICRGRVFVLADTSDFQSRQLAYDLSALGFDVDMCGDHDAVMDVFQDAHTAKGVNCLWTILFVNLDFLTANLELEEVVDDLLALRRSMVKLNVIILSNQVIRRDDRGTTRLQIADVSLRLPISVDRLHEAVWDAKSNNMIWQQGQI